jgi:hypothetical protein
MILEQDSRSDFDLLNVKPPNAISVLPLSSVLLFLKFSQTLAPRERSRNCLEEGSPNFEDLLGPEHRHHTPNPNLEVPDWQYDEVELLEDYEDPFAPLSDHPARPLHQLDTLEIPELSLRSDSRLQCLPDSSFQSLETETDHTIFSRQISNLAYRLDQGMAILDEESSFQPNEIDTTASSSSLSTFEPHKPRRSGSFRSARTGTACSPFLPEIRTPLPAQQSTTFYKPILSLTDAALRTLIHPQPTRLSAGIKFSATNSGSDPGSGQDQPKLTALSDLAPSIFTPGYAQAVAERAPLVPSIAKSLTTFLKYRSGSETGKGGRAEQRGRPEEGEGEVQGDVSEILRGHVWMTMTNGLRISHSANARRLKPLAMPCAWSEESREEDVIVTGAEEMEMLDETFGWRQKSPRRGYEQAEEEEEEEILDGLEGGLVGGDEEDFEEGLLLDDEEVDVSFLKEEFEERCMFGRDVHFDVGEGDGMDDVDVGVEVSCGYHTEEMLF